MYEKTNYKKIVPHVFSLTNSDYLGKESKNSSESRREHCETPSRLNLKNIRWLGDKLSLPSCVEAHLLCSAFDLTYKGDDGGGHGLGG